MPITYDTETDYLYKKGIEKGIEKGEEEGILAEKIEVICNARREGTSIELIAKIVKLTPQRVRAILDKAKID